MAKPVTLETLERHKDNPCAVLACNVCGGSFSADPSDYFMLQPNQVLRCSCCSPMFKRGPMLRLLHREVRECELT